MEDQLGDHCFMYFPGHYMWSQGVLIGLGLIPFGAADAGEVFKAGQRLMNHVGDNERWFTEWNAIAEDTESLAAREERQKHFRTSGGAYIRAATYHFLQNALFHQKILVSWNPTRK